MDTDTPLERIRRILFASETNESTTYPVWFIISPTRGLMKKEDIPYCFNGPFFSRKSATEHFKNHAYRYSQKSYIWCSSGHDCPDYRNLIDAAREEKNEESL